ncbi:MAG: AEC family transporter [Burkholderiaceae bacterium]|nr:AEC family transporter [Burkholderiaceae bacterium]
MNPVTALFPDLALIAIGQLLLRSLVRERGVWNGLEKLIYYVLFPALLFDTILHMRLELSTALPAVVVALAAVGVGIGLGWLARPLLDPEPARFAAGVQCAFRFNSYVMLALSQRIGGDAGLSLAAILIGVSVPVVNFAAVIPLARHAQSRLGVELARNPLILATLAGLVGHALGLRLPAPVEATLGRLGGASIALGLLAVGAGLQLDALRGRWNESRSTLALGGWITAVKMLAMPAAAFALSSLLGLDAPSRTIVVLYAAMPTAPSAYILAARMGGDASFTALLMTVSMLIAAVTLPLWLAALVA